MNGEQPAGESKGIRILCVDDEASILLLLGRLIATLGYEAVTARDGLEAMDILQRETFPLVLVDLTMPQMDGMELMQHIRAHYPQTAVIVVSATVDRYSFNELITAGATDFIQKPFSADELVAKLNRVLREWRLFNSLRAEIEERRRSERALQEKQAQLIHAGRLTALGEMATAMAHEINQPLNVISITLQTWELLQQRGRLEPLTMLEEAKKLRGNVERISRIIDHVRSFGRIHQEIQPISLKQVTREALSLCRMQFRNHGIQLEEACQEEVPAALAVGTELEQVALNLLSNARAAVETRFGPRGGSKGLVRVSIAATPERIALTVEDNGGGIKEENLPRIFDPFFTTKPTGKGTGLGLSISRQIMEKFGGGLECVNHPGEGAVFTAWLPVAGSAG